MARVKKAKKKVEREKKETAAAALGEKAEVVEEKMEMIENKEQSTEEKKAEPVNYNKQTKIVVVIMAISLVSVFLVYFLAQGTNNFNYNNMKFYKEQEGPVMFYKSLLGYVTASGESIPFILKLRNDPRKLGKIPIEGNMTLRKEAILSLSPGIANCSDTYITMLDFSMTLKGFGVKASAATTDKSYATEHNATLANCKDAKNKTVIVMQEGNQTKITQTGDCYTIEIADCNIQESFERFIIGVIEDSANTAKSSL